MGIPAYFKYLKHKHKNVILTDYPENVDRLFLDFNGLIHGCKEQVLLDHGNEQDIYKSVLKYVEYIVNHIRPKLLLYISVDGVAPRAKMEQQRKRRFKSYQDKILAPPKDTNEPKPRNWDSNAITPGTKFMYYLDKALYNSSYLRKLAGTIKVIISNSSVPGEGEQKIYRYMRLNPGYINVVHGLDADLVMLSLLQYHKNTIYLYREYDNKPTFVSISNLANSICIPPTDYVMLSFLMGNDFIPKSYALNLRTNVLNLVLILYNEVYSDLKTRLVVNNTINKHFLISLFKKIEVREDELVLARANKSVYKNFAYHGNSRQDRFDYWPDYHRNKEVFINFGNPGWRKRYYQEIGCTNETITESMCAEFCRGLSWNLEYYTCQDPTKDCDQSWYYPYLHAPLFSDLIRYLDVNQIIPPRSDTTYTSLEQLVIVLPPQSAHLLPISWRKPVLKNKSHFPRRFELDPIGCVFRWECPPILPRFDNAILDEIKQNILTENEVRRMVKHKDFVLRSYVNKKQNTNILS